LPVGAVAPSLVVRHSQCVDILVGINIKVDYLAKGKDWLCWVAATEVNLFSDYFSLGLSNFYDQTVALTNQAIDALG
jgi:hypothetical protein